MGKAILTVEKIDAEYCRICYSRKSDKEIYGDSYVESFRGNERLIMFALCKMCFENYCAVSEAKAEERRFTEIGCGIKGISSYNGYRCVCGAVTHGMLGSCVRCSKDKRMMDKYQAECILIDRALKELRREIRQQVKANIQQ